MNIFESDEIYRKRYNDTEVVIHHIRKTDLVLFIEIKYPQCVHTMYILDTTVSVFSKNVSYPSPEKFTKDFWRYIGAA